MTDDALIGIGAGYLLAHVLIGIERAWRNRRVMKLRLKNL